MTYDEFKQNFLPEFIKIKSFAGKIKYAGQYLQRIGSGSGRIVYDIDGEKVLKLAKNTKGVAQNETEAGIGYYHDTQHIVTIIFDGADNNEWLIAEKGKKITEARIKQLTGIPSLSELYMYLKNFHSSNNGQGNIFKQDTDIIELLNENEFSQDLQNFIANYNQSPGDFGRPSTYGEVLRNGQPTIVLTDYGLNDEVYDTHYSGKPKQHGYRMYELYNFADGNDDILGDMPPQDAVDTRQGMWALMPYGVGDGPGVINEDFISFVLNRDKYPTRPLPSTPYILDEFHDIVNNLKEVLNHVSDKKKFYNNLLELQNYLIRGKFYDREPLEKENIITEEEMVNEDVLGVPKEVADNIANTVAQKLNFGTPNHIGDGTFGYAYDIGNNMILKVTKDPSEANENLELIGKPLEHIAKPYKVFSIKTSTIDKPLYVIILEKLKTDLAKFTALRNRLDFAFKKIMDVEYGDVVDYYVNGHSLGLNVDEKMVEKYMAKNPKDAEFFYAIIEIGKEAKKYGVESMDYVSPSNLGYKPNGSLGFFDVGFGNFLFQSNTKPEVVQVDEDGSSLYSTDNSFGQDNFPVHNNIDTSLSIQNDLNANSSLYEDLEYNHVVGDATQDEFEISEGVADKYAEKNFNIKPEYGDFENKYRETQTDKDSVAVKNEDMTILKNPTTLQNVVSDARGIIDKNGNLYIQQNSGNVIHQWIINALVKANLIQNDEYWFRVIPKEFITVQRDESTNKIYAGESSMALYPKFKKSPNMDWSQVPMRNEVMPYYKQFMDKAKQVNPNIDFIPELIFLAHGDYSKELALGENFNERVQSFQPGSSTVEVKKKCRLGGLGNTSVACNQGDINNLDIKPLTEAQNQEFLGYNNDLDQIEKQEKEYQDRVVKIFAETNRKYLQPYLSKEEMDIVVDWVASQNKSGDRVNDENAYNLRNKASDELNKDNPKAGAEYQAEVKKYLNLMQKINKCFIKKKFGLHKKYPTDNRFGVAGDVNVTEVSHFSTTGGAIGILGDGYIMENEEGGVSTTTNKNLVKDIKPVFYHPQSSGYEGISYKNLSTQFVLDFNKIKADGVKFRKGDENRGTHIGEEEIRIYPKDGELDIYAYLKRVIIDPTKEKKQEILNELINILKEKNIQYFIKNNLKSITEEIDPKEIIDDNKAIKAVLSGKRDIGFIELNPNNSKLIKKNNLGIFPVRMVSQNSMMVIIYRDKIKALKLYNIAMSHNGFLSDKSPDEAREIGKLLGYMDASIEEYIRRKYGNKPPIMPDKSPDDYDDLAEQNIQDEGVADTYGEKFGIEHPNANFEKQFNKERSIENQEEYVNDYIIKNPKSLNNIGAEVRGIIDSKGNLYVEQRSDAIHQELIEELHSLGIINYVGRDWHYIIPTEFITVQRYNFTNIFTLGESNVLLHAIPQRSKRYQELNLISRAEALPIFQRFLDLAKQKNPKIDFINEIRQYYTNLGESRQYMDENNNLSENDFPEFEKQINKDNITHELDKVLIKTYKDSDDTVNVYTVNGDEVRDSGFIEWVDGGNHWVDADLPDDEQKYAKHIPADEVWVDDVFLSKPNDLEAIVLHERVESYLIKHYGYNYDGAHEIANKIESVYRKKTKNISDKGESERIASLAYIAFKKKFDKNNKHKKIVNEGNSKLNERQFDKAICKNIQLIPEIQEYLKKFNSDEELLRSGGIPTDLLDRAAYGFDDTLKQLMPNQLSIKWKDDFDNVIFGIKKKGLTNIEYAKSVNLNEPIDVSFNGRKFYIEDGHHRFYAAKILNKPLNVNLEIKANPIAVLGGDMEYDDFHRCVWNQVHNLSEGAVHARLNEYPGQMDKVYVRPGIYDQEDRDAIMSITGGDAYTKLIADMFYYLTNRYNKKMVKPTKLSGRDRELLVKVHQRLKEYDKNVIPIHDLYAQEHNAHPLEKMNDLEWRKLIIGRIKQLPSVLVRNLKNDIRKERNHYEIEALYHTIKDIQNSIKLIEQVKPEHREKIEKKIYSSANDTFEAVKKRLEDTTIPYLSQDDAIEGIIEKVNDLGGEAEVLYQGNNKLIIKINTGEAMAYIGCSSQWCFATNPQVYWDNYVSDSGFATIVFDFDEPESEPNRMLVVLEDGEVYDMYNELVEDGQDYLYDLGVVQYIPEPQEELVENVEVNEEIDASEAYHDEGQIILANIDEAKLMMKII